MNHLSIHTNYEPSWVIMTGGWQSLCPFLSEASLKCKAELKAGIFLTCLWIEIKSLWDPIKDNGYG